jgi:cell division transport system permease protein
MKRGADADRALFWTLAIAAFAAAAVGLAARAVDRSAAGVEQTQANYAIVRVIAPDGPEAMATAENALANAPHVASAAPITPRRAADLLAEWGGAPVAEADIPPLRLIEIELEPTPPQTDVAGDLVAALALGGVTAEVVQAPAQAGVGGVAARARLGALWGAVAFAIVVALIISLAARGFASRRRELVQVLADIGATRGQAAGRIADEAARTGFIAGIAGAAIAGLLAVALILLLVPSASFETLPTMILPIDAMPLAIAPFLAAVSAAMGARAGAESFYAEAARLA